MTLPTTMRVQEILAFGAPSQLQVGQRPIRLPGPGEVLVRQRASSVNPVDTKIRARGSAAGPALPAVLGCDIAGDVAAIGSAVKDFAIGDAVYGCGGGVVGMDGAYAEYITTDARLLAPKPASLSYREAAALPLVTLTAWEGLDRAGVKAGDRVLVLGGTGGVGHVVVQLAQDRGALVAATVSSADKAALARELGAHQIIDYRRRPLAESVAELTEGQGFDVVFDATGGNDLAPAFAAARINGQVVCIVSAFQADLTPMHMKGLSLHAVFMLIPMLHGRGREAHGLLLRQATRRVDAGALRPLLDAQRFDLDHLADAHRKLEAGQALGKLVIDID